MNNAEEANAIALYIAQDEKIDAARGECTELREAMAEYIRRLDVVASELKNTRERLEEGVSKTAFKAWEATQEMRTNIERMVGRIEKGEILSDSQEKRLDRIDKFNDKVIYGMLIVVFLSIFSTVMAFLWNYRPH